MTLQNAAVGGLKTENLIDGKLMKELDDSGFIDQLYNSYGVKPWSNISPAHLASFWFCFCPHNRGRKFRAV